MTKGAKRDDVKDDIIKMIIIGVERGNMITTMHERSSETAAKIIRDLKKDYALVDKPGKSLNALTLSRVALAFPHLACEYSAMAFSRTVPASSLPVDFPLQMTHSAFANLIPVSNNNIMMELSQMLLYYQVRFSMVVDKKAKRGTYEECKEKCLKYIEAGYNSTYVDEEKRVELLVGWGILITASKMSPNTIKVSNAVKKLFEIMIGGSCPKALEPLEVST